MASHFSAKRGSMDTLKVSTRCGLSPCLCQMRCTVASLRSTASAIVRVDQCVWFAGFSCVVEKLVAPTRSFVRGDSQLRRYFLVLFPARRQPYNPGTFHHADVTGARPRALLQFLLLFGTEHYRTGHAHWGRTSSILETSFPE